ncbi:hypothetical protein HEP86_00085 [Streptomyces sp. RPA4-5]|nr:hypothetical protein HEP86_00085 [Streptomyces sp. RPA4-5]
MGDVYSYMLREQQIQLTVSDSVVAPRKPCIWGENRFVQRRGQDISAVQKIDMVLATLYRCQDCWHASPLGSSSCSQCQGTRLEQTEHRVWGWLGVQRYLHQRDYGIDFFRDGRKIIARDKRLFSFTEDLEDIVEYPVDSPARGGWSVRSTATMYPSTSPIRRSTTTVRNGVGSSMPSADRAHSLCGPRSWDSRPTPVPWPRSLPHSAETTPDCGA